MCEDFCPHFCHNLTVPVYVDWYLTTDGRGHLFLHSKLVYHPDIGPFSLTVLQEMLLLMTKLMPEFEMRL